MVNVSNKTKKQQFLHCFVAELGLVVTIPATPLTNIYLCVGSTLNATSPPIGIVFEQGGLFCEP